MGEMVYWGRILRIFERCEERKSSRGEDRRRAMWSDEVGQNFSRRDIEGEEQNAWFAANFKDL